MDYHDHPFWTERFESEAELRESNALVFDAAWVEEHFGSNGPDENDIAAMDLAMDRDMNERKECWLAENAALRARIAELEGEEA